MTIKRHNFYDDSLEKDFFLNVIEEVGSIRAALVDTTRLIDIEMMYDSIFVESCRIISPDIFIPDCFFKQ